MSKIRANRWETLDGVGAGVIYVDTVADLQALDTSGLVEGQQASAGESGIFAWSPGTPASRADGVFFILADGGGGCWVMQSGKISEDATFYLPDDYDHYQDAINDLSPKIRVTNGAKIRLVGLSGYEITRGVFSEHSDHGMFWIQHEDEVAIVSSEFEGSGNAFDGNNLFIAVASRMPVLDCLIDAQHHVTGACYYGTETSTGFVTPGSGVINSGGYGIGASASHISAPNTHWDGSTGTDTGCAIRCQQAGTLSVQGATADDCPNAPPVYASRGSRIQFQNGSAQTSGDHAMIARRSYINATRANVSGASNRGAWVNQGGEICFNDGTADNCGSRALAVDSGGRMAARGASVKNCSGHAISADSGWIDISNGDVTGSAQRAYRIENGGVITATGTASDRGSDEINVSANIRSFNTTTPGGIVYDQDSPAFIYSNEVNGATYTFYGTGHLVADKQMTLTDRAPGRLREYWDFDTNFTNKPTATGMIDHTHPDSVFAPSVADLTGPYAGEPGQSVEFRNDRIRVYVARINGRPDFEPGDTIRVHITARGFWR